MKINKRIKLPDGEVEVNCTFTDEETDVIFTVGLAELLRVGAIPFSLLQTQDAAKIAPGGHG